MKSLHTLRIVAAVLAMFLTCGSVLANIGTVQFSAGDVKIRDKAGVVRDAKKGDLLNEGDTVLTGTGASAQLKMSDGGILAVRPQTELRIDRYVFSGKEDGTENAFMSLVKGGFRTITGVIGRTNKDNYRIGTLTATIGIRGTDHEPFFIPPVPPGAPQPATPPGTYDKVNVGTAFIATPLGSVNIAPNQVGFAAPNQTPQLLPVMPDIFKATPPVNQAQQQKEAEKEKQAAAENEKQAAAKPAAEKPAAEKPAGGAGGQSQETQGTPAAEKAADTPAPAVAAAPSEVRSTAVVDNTSAPLTTTATTTSGTGSGSNPSAPTAITQEVTGSSDSGSLEVNLTEQTVSTSTGTTAPISQGAYASQAQVAADEAQFDANLAVGAHSQALTFETQTNTAVTAIGVIAPVSVAPATAAITTAGSDIAAAQTAVTAAALLTPVDLTAATSAIATTTVNFNTGQTALVSLGTMADLTAASSAVAAANTAIGSATTAVGALPGAPASLALANSAISVASTSISNAQTAVTSVNALPAPDVALAGTNAALSASTRTTAETQAAQAAAAIAANGAFADAVYAVPANTATQSSLTQVQGSDGLVQAAATNAATQNAAFNTTKTNAGANLATANTGITAANAALVTATAENTNFTNAKAAATASLTNATTSVANANTALTDATNFNVTFASNQTAAQSSLTAASGNLATANTQLTSAQAANAALTAAIAAAQQALTNANAALAAANAQLATATSSNTTIATVQSAVTGLSAQAAAGVAAAQTAAGLAQVAATASQVAASDALVKQNAGDFAGAQAALGVALARLGDAQVQLTAAQTAQGQSQTAATTANAQLTAAQSAVTAATTAVTAAVTAAGNASTLAGTATTQAAAVSGQQAAATTAASNASAAAGSAQGDVSSAQTSIGAAGSAKTSAQASAGTAQTAAGTAQTQAGTAQTQATAAGTAYTAATAAASSAETQANAAGTQAGAAQTEAAAATTAQGAAVAAVATTTTELANTQTAAGTVATNYQKAQYNNPAVASANFGHMASSQAPSTGTIRSFMGSITPVSNTNYVLDGNKSLVEIRNTSFEGPGPTDNIDDAVVKFSGGVALDLFKAPDNTVYLGRIQGGQIDVDDNANVVAPFARLLGPASAHWLVGLMPGPSSTLTNTFGPVNNVQTMVGTANYALTAATRPTDSFGNVGTLNSASVTANFSAQTASAALNLGFSTADVVNISARDLNITASTPNVPLMRDGSVGGLFFEAPGVISCTGANCAPGGYVGEVGGTFGGTATGAVGTGVGLSYGFVPAPGVMTDNGLDADYIHGVAVLNSAAAPATGVLSNFNGSANVRNEVLYSTGGIGGTPNGGVYFGSIRDTVSGLTANPGFVYNGPRTSNNVMFDAAGNLVRIFDTSYVVFDRGDDVTATTTNFRVPTPLANAQVSFGASGSVAAEHYEYTPTGYTDPIIRLGRWQGGAVNVLDTLTGDAYLDPILGSAHWLIRQGVPSFTGVAGTHTYSKVASTSPTDNFGNVGVLERARLAVDFDRSLVSLGLSVSMPTAGGLQFNARAEDAPIVSGGFNVSTADALSVSCYGPGCAPSQSYGGRVRGAFAGEQAAGTPGLVEGAYYRYTFNTNYANAAAAASAGRTYEEYTNGYVAFGRDPSAGVGSTYVTPRSNPAQFSVLGPSPNPPGDAVILSAYNYINGMFTQSQTNSFDSPGSNSLWGSGLAPGYTIDGSGNLTVLSSVFEDDNITISGGSGPVNFSAQGISHGYVYQPTITGQDWSGSFLNRPVLDSFHWLRGPALFPWYAGNAMVAAVDGGGSTVPVGYAQLGGLVTNQSGVPGSVTGTLQVNFNAQTVNTSINAVVSGGTFAATANGVSLDDGAFFWASSNGAFRHNINSLTFNGSPTNTFGSLNGLLMNTTPGAAPNDGILGGAGVGFSFNSSTERATGTLVFGNPAYVTTPADGSTFKPSVLMDYRMMLLAQGMKMGDPANSVPQPGAVTQDGSPFNPLTPGTLVSEWDNYQVQFTALSSDRTQFVNSSSVSPLNPQGALVKVDGRETMISNSCSPSVCNNETQLPVRYAFADKTGGGPAPGTAVALETGYDAATGVRWGRWGNGTGAGGGIVNVGDRGSANGASPPPAGSAPATVNLTAQNWHYLITSSQGGPVTIPTTGAANYTLVGGTSPTAFTPGQGVADVGTLGAVTLNVDFLNQKITNFAINASTPGSGSWQATASNLPILQKSIFFAEKTLSGGGDLAVTRNGLPTNTAGQVVGGFTNGAVAAGMAYSLNQGGPTGVTVSGVAVMKK